jgi:hypothetical protein
MCVCVSDSDSDTDSDSDSDSDSESRSASRSFHIWLNNRIFELQTLHAKLEVPGARIIQLATGLLSMPRSGFRIPGALIC